MWSIVVLTAVVAAGCGRSGSKSAPNTTAGGGTSTTAAAESGLAAGNFGSLKKVCGPKPAGMTLKATGTGVTADSIQVSTSADPGFSGRPGLNQELFDTATAFTNWCNSLGGINGRKIDLKLRDAKLTEFQQRMIEACNEGDFMLVGAGNVLDDTGQKDRLKCGLPGIVGYFVSANAEASDLGIEPIPNPSTAQPVGDLNYLFKKFPDSKKAVGVLTGNLATTELQSKKNEEAFKALGANLVYSGVYNAVGEPTWRPFAEAIKSKGVKGLSYVGEPANLPKLMQALADIGYRLDWVRSDANLYDPLVLTAGGATDGLYVRGAIHPFLDPALAKKNPATQDYLDLMDRYNKGGKTAYLGVQSLSAWLLFAQAVKECGADVTRDCVYAKALVPTDWTGGGLHAPANVKEKKQVDCFVLYQVKNGKFTMPDISPNNGIYNCGPDNLVPLKGDYGTGEKCPNPAYATDPKPSNCANK
ncbi:MAG: ABC transporter substrate-binding protein [Acidimicrobiia bacterium]